MGEFACHSKPKVGLYEMEVQKSCLLNEYKKTRLIIKVEKQYVSVYLGNFKMGEFPLPKFANQ